MPLPARDHELIQIMDASWSDAARRAGPHLACRIGCTQCCHGAFAIHALDAARLRAGMDVLRSTNRALAAEIECRAQAWIAEHAAAFPGNPATGLLGASQAAHQAFDDFANDAPCPALNPVTGGCDVYAWRPMTCRVFGPPVRIDEPDASAAGALGCCELCFTVATDEEIAACEMQVPHDVESTLLDELHDPSETVVAFALVNRTTAGPR
ncbi:MAG TPA: YkgJ family cysteine cluster protein [Terracidiphilus sp.]|jgi:Fe-S-cluster containining protein|nr:YkgJ family cysteine cluster protein [Terracidiphilus sp.]